ncbi:MAG: T9SS type A sorting domain-containing protein [Crocinitomicaceae bacterium]|jgi:hypothetical protein|nr:T9SS type A sorting domain-containing protein [Crocinitomicaceae bacterium]MBT6030804.1 T9SS type A sorting domain-containing protein [Crocinitomicaceae bacterium]MBT6515149.1 T9SS type A sorting domain-containing protein [Crocinitomicaceae bacterium]
MKKNYIRTLLITLLGTSNLYYSQSSTISLNENNCDAIISDIGTFFNNSAAGLPGYEIPKGSGIHAIYSAALWFGGPDASGMLKQVVPQYASASQDMWPGALTANGAATLPSPNPLGQTIWTISKTEIDNHIMNFSNPGYVAPTEILNWPAHGDTSVDQAFYLAPFIDMDANGYYNPLAGDYPCIKGDRAIYTITNDKGGLLGSGSYPIGIEVHYLFYQYNSTVEAINNTTFLDARIINRSTQTIYDYVTSFWADTDLGGPNDDHFGCDSLRNLMYTYNADNQDDDNLGLIGYGAGPPAIGIMCLNEKINSAGMFSNSGVYPYNDPSAPVEFHYVMNGKGQDGLPWLDDLGQPTRFMYSGDPNNPSEWSEYSNANTPGDRRMIMSVNKDNPLMPFEEFQLHFAIVYARDTNHLHSVEMLFDVADDVQDFYDSSHVDCQLNQLSVSEMSLDAITIFPNPTQNFINIKHPEDIIIERTELWSLDGKLVKRDLKPTQINLDGFSAGLYWFNLFTNQGIKTVKLLKID